MENEIDYKIHFEKNTCYSDSGNNYILPKEITVTITLNEYRKLIEENAKASYRFDEMKQKKDSEISLLKNEVKRLEKKILENEEETEEC